jgi:hypothetical protein
MTRGFLRFVRRNTIALLALFLALGGTTYAASTALIGRNTVASPQVVNGSLKTLDLSKSARKALKGNRGLRGLRGLQGAKGATGAQGVQGATGAAGSAVAYARVNADGTLDAARSKGITAAMVTLQSTSAYCFHDLPFTVNNTVATVQYDGGVGTSDEMVQVAQAGAGYTADCSGIPNTVVEVAGYTGGNYGPVPFFIIFN